MENQLQIYLKNEHYKNAHDYLLNCPLELALKEYYPEAFISVGASKVIIIFNTKEDKEGIIYSVSDNYNVKLCESNIKLAKEGGVATSTITLTKKGVQENYFLHPPQEDHVDHPSLVLPDDLFT